MFKFKKIVQYIIEIIDHITPRGDTWVFAVGDKGIWNGDHKYLYEMCKRDESVTAVILDKKAHNNDDIVINPKSAKGLFLLCRAQVVVIHHGTGDCPFKPSPYRRVICNPFHGIPIKAIGYADKRYLKKRSQKAVAKEWVRCNYIPVSSRLHALSMSACVYHGSNVIRVTGLPRNDVMLLNSHELPLEYQKSEKAAIEALDGRKLILYAPTFSDSGHPVLNIEGHVASRINTILEGTQYVFGIRRHINEESVATDEYSKNIISLGSDVVGEAELVLRHVDLLITDGSSIWLQYLLKGGPMIWFGGISSIEERGLLYDVELIYPGLNTESLDDLLETLHQHIQGSLKLDKVLAEKYRMITKLFHKYNDGKSAMRIIGELKERIK